jgi:hypothetical protein
LSKSAISLPSASMRMAMLRRASLVAWVGSASRVGPQPGGLGRDPRQALAAQCLAQFVGCGDDQVFELVVGSGARLHRATAGDPQHPDGFDDRGGVFRDHLVFTGQRTSRRALGVQRV